MTDKTEGWTCVLPQVGSKYLTTAAQEICWDLQTCPIPVGEFEEASWKTVPEKLLKIFKMDSKEPKKAYIIYDSFSEEVDAALLRRQVKVAKQAGWTVLDATSPDREVQRLMAGARKDLPGRLVVITSNPSCLEGMESHRVSLLYGTEDALPDLMAQTNLEPCNFLTFLRCGICLPSPFSLQGETEPKKPPKPGLYVFCSSAGIVTKQVLEISVSKKCKELRMESNDAFISGSANLISPHIGHVLFGSAEGRTRFLTEACDEGAFPIASIGGTSLTADAFEDISTDLLSRPPPPSPTPPVEPETVGGRRAAETESPAPPVVPAASPTDNETAQAMGQAQRLAEVLFDCTPSPVSVGVGGEGGTRAHPIGVGAFSDDPSADALKQEQGGVQVVIEKEGEGGLSEKPTDTAEEGGGVSGARTTPQPFKFSANSAPFSPSGMLDVTARALLQQQAGGMEREKSEDLAGGGGISSSSSSGYRRPFALTDPIEGEAGTVHGGGRDTEDDETWSIPGTGGGGAGGGMGSSPGTGPGGGLLFLEGGEEGGAGGGRFGSSESSGPWENGQTRQGPAEPLNPNVKQNAKEAAALDGWDSLARATAAFASSRSMPHSPAGAMQGQISLGQSGRVGALTGVTLRGEGGEKEKDSGTLSRSQNRRLPESSMAGGGPLATASAPISPSHRRPRETFSWSHNDNQKEKEAQGENDGENDAEGANARVWSVLRAAANRGQPESQSGSAWRDGRDGEMEVGMDGRRRRQSSMREERERDGWGDGEQENAGGRHGREREGKGERDKRAAVQRETKLKAEDSDWKLWEGRDVRIGEVVYWKNSEGFGGIKDIGPADVSGPRWRGLVSGELEGQTFFAYATTIAVPGDRRRNMLEASRSVGWPPEKFRVLEGCWGVKYPWPYKPFLEQTEKVEFFVRDPAERVNEDRLECGGVRPVQGSKLQYEVLREEWHREFGSASFTVAAAPSNDHPAAGGLGGRVTRQSSEAKQGRGHGGFGTSKSNSGILKTAESKEGEQFEQAPPAAEFGGRGVAVRGGGKVRGGKGDRGGRGGGYAEEEDWGWLDERDRRDAVRERERERPPSAREAPGEFRDRERERGESYGRDPMGMSGWMDERDIDRERERNRDRDRERGYWEDERETERLLPRVRPASASSGQAPRGDRGGNLWEEWGGGAIERPRVGPTSSLSRVEKDRDRERDADRVVWKSGRVIFWDESLGEGEIVEEFGPQEFGDRFAVLAKNIVVAPPRAPPSNAHRRGISVFIGYKGAEFFAEDAPWLVNREPVEFQTGGTLQGKVYAKAVRGRRERPLAYEREMQRQGLVGGAEGERGGPRQQFKKERERGDRDRERDLALRENYRDRPWRGWGPGGEEEFGPDRERAGRGPRDRERGEYGPYGDLEGHPRERDRERDQYGDPFDLALGPPRSAISASASARGRDREYEEEGLYYDKGTRKQEARDRERDAYERLWDRERERGDYGYSAEREGRRGGGGEYGGRGERVRETRSSRARLEEGPAGWGEMEGEEGGRPDRERGPGRGRGRPTGSLSSVGPMHRERDHPGSASISPPKRPNSGSATLPASRISGSVRNGARGFGEGKEKERERTAERAEETPDWRAEFVEDASASERPDMREGQLGDADKDSSSRDPSNRKTPTGNQKPPSRGRMGVPLRDTHRWAPKVPLSSGPSSPARVAPQAGSGTGTGSTNESASAAGSGGAGPTSTDVPTEDKGAREKKQQQSPSTGTGGEGE
uniref:Uncharacterized protein n=1 Tax=Chromera velia CCMP2878 TaxID=1169474 RepID=A0A0G4I9B3_9ALVE|eukprot:Cvel_12098.t1-p1 / transcript=Cvel_12098.t1 / gene=Cvel_12098 / organism=Chromera_velia_CCMP2878 / gene_product=hypothetical protein / transcript_product=hypothetical protein / location=Cvel_scaffold779:32629-40886(-) / protein_length=1743 / sequence_SO=supercontig / SO=protein_coding / is_pseudo=false